MELEVVDQVSVASGLGNEDRVGTAPPLAWVIDGATDVVPEALTSGGTDAAWFAAALERALRAVAAEDAESLAGLAATLAARIAPEFAAAARRPPEGRREHPSASGIVVRTRGAGLEYLSIGDCTLLAEDRGRRVRIGVDEHDAGDRWVAEALTRRTAGAAAPTRADLWPQLRAQRARMNTEEGYGVFSITPTPARFVRHGTLPLEKGARILLATDGVMRLVDVFRRYDTAQLFEAAWAQGLAPLVAELRAIEAADDACTRYPRAKTSDDATALLLRLTAAP